jgi:hypothetical protein
MIWSNAKGKQGALVGRDRKRVFAGEVRTISAENRNLRDILLFPRFFMQPSVYNENATRVLTSYIIHESSSPSDYSLLSAEKILVAESIGEDRIGKNRSCRQVNL